MLITFVLKLIKAVEYQLWYTILITLVFLFTIFVQEFGTTLQDAERRDFTINALFYNLQTRKVEDFTHLVSNFVTKENSQK